MTGYGRAGRFSHGLELSAEARSVNHKGIDLKVNVPSWLLELEQALTRSVRTRLQRGRVSIVVEARLPASESVLAVFDLPAIERHKAQLEGLIGALGLRDSVTLPQLLAMPGIYRQVEKTVSPSDLEAALTELVAEAVDNLVSERDREGAALAEDFASRVAAISRYVAAIEAELPVARDAFLVRLRERVAELTERHGLQTITDERLVQEVILYADRSDIAEELTRARAHLAALKHLLESHDPDRDGPVGKKLDFYFQEMIRETNTMGSKSQSAVIATNVVEIRCEIERLREQVLNVE
jgi:uncharacterized protein (TIGR00255 family)